MKITIRDYSSNSPVSGVPVVVDGVMVGTTDSSGVIDNLTPGVMISSPAYFKVEFRDAGADKEIWIDQTAAVIGGGGMPPPTSGS